MKLKEFGLAGGGCPFPLLDPPLVVVPGYEMDLKGNTEDGFLWHHQLHVEVNVYLSNAHYKISPLYRFIRA